MDAPLRFAAPDATLAWEGLEDVKAAAEQLKQLDELRDEINPKDKYLDGAPLSGASAPHPPPPPPG